MRKKSILTALGALLILAVGFVAGYLVHGPHPPGTSLSAVVVAPDVVGMRLDQADTRIQAAGLKILIEDPRTSDSVPPDHVLMQQPAAGARVKAGTRISVTLSAGPARGSKLKRVP